MVLRLAVIGAALVIMGLLHVWGNGTPTMVGGGVLLAVAAVVGVVQHQRGVPISRFRR